MHREQMEAIERWFKNLPIVDAEIFEGDVAIFVIDMVNGFATEGVLASPRVQALSAPIASFLAAANAAGVCPSDMTLAQDTHTSASREFAAFPAHCLAGSTESQTVVEIAALPFAGDIPVVEKNSLNVFLPIKPNSNGTIPLDQFVLGNYHRVIFVGDCTDLCVMANAMHLRLMANAQNRDLEVVVIANLVDTYDMPITVAEQIGAFSHDGDFFHQVSLYQMALSGCRVVNFAQ